MSYLIVPKLVETTDQEGDEDYFLKRQTLYAWILDQRQKKRRKCQEVELPPDGIPLPETRARVVSDAGQQWFEFMWVSPEPVLGNAAAGWTDLGYYCQLRVDYSNDLVNWSPGKFVDAPVPLVERPDGTREIWCRALNPVNAQIKTGALVCESTAADGDARNNPITSVKLGGTLLALPRYPYSMPTAAANLQADIVAAGFPGTIVTATSATVWRISVPTVNYVSYADTSRVGWPGYLVADMFGQMTQTVDGRSFQGTFVNAAGVPIKDKGFARLVITPILR